VAMQVPPSVNKMDVLNEYFGRFGPVSALQINQSRHEAIITFGRLEDAEEALKWPVLNDPSIGLRPWRAKAGQRGPDEAPADDDATLSLPVTVPVQPVQSGPAVVRQASSNMMLESGAIQQAKRKKEELEERRKLLLSGLTDQLKIVMSKISDPATSEKNREQLQGILASIKEKISALTPVEQEKETARRQLQQQKRPAPFQAKKHTLDNRPRPSSVLLSKLPEELRGQESEVRLRDALGEGVEWVRKWSEDGTSCVVRFSDRRLAEATIQAQKVWGYAAQLQEEERPPPFRRKPPGPRIPRQRHTHKVYRPPPMPAQEVPPSPETEAFDSDVPEDELPSYAIAEPEQELQMAEAEVDLEEAAENGAAPQDSSMPIEEAAPSEDTGAALEASQMQPEKEAAAENGMAPAELSATEPSAEEPPASEPLVTEPPATEPPAVEPPAAKPSATEPTPAEPEAMEPEAAEATEPAPEATDTTMQASEAAESGEADAAPTELAEGDQVKDPEPKAKAKAKSKAKAKASATKASAKPKATAAKASAGRGRGRGRGS